MEMRAARMMGICGLLVVGALGCKRVSKDTTPVVASVGNEKITVAAFNAAVADYLGDPAKTQDLLNNPQMREQRNQFLGTLVNQKALLQFVKAEGVDKDPKAKIEVESAVANAYFQILADRIMTKAEPTDADLKTLYDDYVLQAKAANQAAGLPSFEQVKAQLPGAWKRKQGEVARQALLTQLNQKCPVVFAPEYHPTQAP
ncbi:MAG: SurA N-terminal domain-containing protein [Holophaga sp.]|nr:SurA N-terminal domain-containing protein [Holophaga sp.]